MTSTQGKLAVVSVLVQAAPVWAPVWVSQVLVSLHRVWASVVEAPEGPAVRLLRLLGAFILTLTQVMTDMHAAGHNKTSSRDAMPSGETVEDTNQLNRTFA